MVLSMLRFFFVKRRIRPGLAALYVSAALAALMVFESGLLTSVLYGRGPAPVQTFSALEPIQVTPLPTNGSQVAE